MELFHFRTAEEKAEEKARRKAQREELRSKRKRKTIERPAPREFSERVRITEPEAAVIMLVKRVYNMHRKDKVVTGTIEKGPLYVGDEVYICSDGRAIDKTKVTDIAQFRKHYDCAPVGSMVQVTLDAPNVDVAKGDVLVVKEV